ncbi:MAG: DUF1929 domain-containing protein, partial [Solirubrobacteraceae bacterium]|nr:DUF1929 domain-containing protein [Solirubrobacteraceae bacterium]
GATSAAAHDETPAPANFTPAERQSQLALQSALGTNAPDGAQHASEHASQATAQTQFAALPKARQQAIRAGAARAAAAAPGAADAATVGAWEDAPFPAPTYAINMVMLPTGKVLVLSMGRDRANCQDRCADGSVGNAGLGLANDGNAAVWDPAKGYGADAFKILPPPDADLTGYDLTEIKKDPAFVSSPTIDADAALSRPAPIFCSGQVQTADGRVLIAGGNLEARGIAYGLRFSFLFDPVSETWTREPDLKHARWYPTLTRLPSGRVAILGGRNEHGKDVASIELYPEQAAPVPGVAGNTPGTTGHATDSLYDDASDPANPLGYKNVGTPGEYSAGLGYYPFSMVLPDGRLSVSRWGTGNLGILNPASGVFAYSGGPRYKTALGKYTTAFPAPGDENGTPEMVIAGGLGIDQDTYGPTDELLSDVWAIQPGPASADGTDWQTQPSLNVPRRNAIATLLPDGSAVILGGGDADDRVPLDQIQDPTTQPQRQVELWDPATRAWTLGPAADVPRGYHSSAVLLPDGRVLTGGDDWVSYVLDPDHSDAFDSTFQIYSPPYLFKGSRPVIDALPARAEYGGTFAVTGRALDGHTITSATLVAPGSVTHAFDSNQRVLELPVQSGGDGTYRVTAPTTANAAPPGDYMLFLLDERGVPSVGKFLRIAAERGASVPSAEPTPTPAEPSPAPTDPGVGPSAPAPAGELTDPGVAPGVQSSPAPQPQVVQATPSTPPSARPAAPNKPQPAVRLSGKRLSINIELRPTGKRCPTAVRVTTTVSGRKTRTQLKPSTAKSKAGTRVCRIKRTVSLARTPTKRATVRVTFSGRGIKTRSVTAVRSLSASR